MNTPKISIVIPIYNVEKYLSKCLNSIINQTLSDIEIICVNDGSPDNSLEIIKEFASQDNRIKIINQRNVGVSQARNNAIKIASGQYILFVDGDDWLETDACETVYHIASKYKTDIVMFACRLEYKSKTLYKYAFKDKWIEFNGKQCEALHRRHAGMVGEELAHPEEQDFLCSACTKIYRKDIIVNNNLSFVDLSEIGSYEDGLFNLHYFKYVRKAIYINNSLYHYRKDNEISNTSNYKSNLPVCWEYLFGLIEQYIAMNNLTEEYRQGLQNRIALGLIGLGLNTISSEKKASDKINEIKRIISTQEYRSAIEQLQIQGMPLHWKMFFFSAKINSASAVYIMLVIMNKLRGKV